MVLTRPATFPNPTINIYLGTRIYLFFITSIIITLQHKYIIYTLLYKVFRGDNPRQADTYPILAAKSFAYSNKRLELLKLSGWEKKIKRKERNDAESHRMRTM